MLQTNTKLDDLIRFVFTICEQIYTKFIVIYYVFYHNYQIHHPYFLYYAFCHNFLIISHITTHRIVHVVDSLNALIILLIIGQCIFEVTFSTFTAFVRFRSSSIF